MPEIGYEVTGLQEFRNVARVIGREDRQIPKRMRSTIMREAKVLAKEAGAKMLAQPVKRKGKHTGIRREIAKGVRVVTIDDRRYKDFAGVRVITTTVEEDEAIIPRGFDSRKGWRHPTFGRRGEGDWQTQHGAFSWFVETMDNGQLPIALEFHQHIDDSMDAIANAAHTGR